LEDYYNEHTSKLLKLKQNWFWGWIVPRHESNRCQSRNDA